MHRWDSAGWMTMATDFVRWRLLVAVPCFLGVVPSCGSRRWPRPLSRLMTWPLCMQLVFKDVCEVRADTSPTETPASLQKRIRRNPCHRDGHSTLATPASHRQHCQTHIPPIPRHHPYQNVHPAHPKASTSTSPTAMATVRRRQDWSPTSTEAQDSPPTTPHSGADPRLLACNVRLSTSPSPQHGKHRPRPQPWV